MLNLSVGKRFRPSRHIARDGNWMQLREREPTSSTAPAPSDRPLECLEKDLKPPVIIKPNVPAPNDTEPATPGRNPNPSST